MTMSAFMWRDAIQKAAIRHRALTFASYHALLVSVSSEAWQTAAAFATLNRAYVAAVEARQHTAPKKRKA